jgi:hypothetical protein
LFTNRFGLGDRFLDLFRSGERNIGLHRLRHGMQVRMRPAAAAAALFMSQMQMNCGCASHVFVSQ